jgi:hypothetical protein
VAPKSGWDRKLLRQIETAGHNSADRREKQSQYGRLEEIPETSEYPEIVCECSNFAATHAGFSILQSDHGLKLASVAGGALKVKDELKFSFNILARKKE